MTLVRILAVSIVCLFALAPSSQARSYTFTNLGHLTGGSSSWSDDIIPYAINNNGQIVGQSRGKAFLWENGEMTIVPGGAAHGFGAYDINDSGQVAGIDSSGNAYVWQNNNVTFVASTPQGSSWNQKTRRVNINNNGSVAAFDTLLNDGIAQSMKGSLYGLNDNGQLIGSYGYGFVQTGNMQTILVPSHESHSSIPVAINNTGAAVGTALNPLTQKYEATLWNGSIPQYLNTVVNQYGENSGSLALGINSQGMIVGKSGEGLKSFFGDTAFLYDSTTGEMIDLNTVQLAGAAGMYLVGALDINDKGQIIGVAYDLEGRKHGFLLTPTPIPGAVWLLGTGLFGLIGLRRRRSH